MLNCHLQDKFVPTENTDANCSRHKKKKMSHGSVQIGGNSDSFSDAKSFLKSTELNFFFFFKLHNEEPGIKGT